MPGTRAGGAGVSVSTDFLISEIIELHTLTMRERYAGELETLMERCESEIEKVFGAALLHILFSDEQFRFEFYEYQKHLDSVQEKVWGSGILVPQYEVGRYRVDFFINFIGHEAKPIKIAIECDGHDFHERTKEQARRDRQKDRWLQSKGFIALRFTGSEIWKDPVACAEQVLTLINTKVFFS